MAKRKRALGREVYVQTLFFFAVSSSFAHAQAPEAAAAPKTFDLAAIDAYVAAQVRDQNYAGLALTIVRDGKVVTVKRVRQAVGRGRGPGRAGDVVCGRLGDQAVYLCVYPAIGRGREAVDR